MLNTNILSRIDHLPLIVLNEIAHLVNKARQEGREIIDFSQLNPNLSPPGQAVEKLVQSSLQPHNHRYSSSQGILKLREAFSKWYLNRFEVELNIENEVVVTLGTKQGISHLLLGIISKGENVLLPTPAYPIHQASVLLAGGKLVDVPLIAKEETPNWDTTEILTANSEAFFDRLEKAYLSSNPKAKLMILSFPHNPSTTVVDLGFFERVVKFAKENEIFIIHDFAYADLCFGSYKTPSILQVPGAKDIAVEFYSLSKGLCLAGWRVGCCVGNTEIISVLKKVKSFLDYGAFQPLQIGAIKALESYKSIISETVEVYKSRRDVLVEGLNRINWKVSSPKGSLFVWAKIPDNSKIRSAKELSQMLLEHNVAVCPGDGFGQEYSEYIRFALVEPENRIRLALASIEKVIKDIC